MEDWPLITLPLEWWKWEQCESKTKNTHLAGLDLTWRNLLCSELLCLSSGNSNHCVNWGCWLHKNGCTTPINVAMSWISQCLLGGKQTWHCSFVPTTKEEARDALEFCSGTTVCCCFRDKHCNRLSKLQLLIRHRLVVAVMLVKKWILSTQTPIGCNERGSASRRL